MIAKGEEYSARLRSYSKSTIEKMAAMMSGAKSLKDCEKILHSVAESETEAELIVKLDSLAEENQKNL